MLSKGYDIVINGYEVAGGSIRIHDNEMQKQIFEIMNMKEKEINEKFGFFIDALKFGTPPHGGIALVLIGWLCYCVELTILEILLHFQRLLLHQL